jgi:hypothetical protein
MAVFWVLAPNCVVKIHQYFRGLCCLHHQGDEGGSTDLWNAGKLVPVCMALKPGRQPSSYSPPWEFQVRQVAYLVHSTCVLASPTAPGVVTVATERSLTARFVLYSTLRLQMYTSVLWNHHSHCFHYVTWHYPRLKATEKQGSKWTCSVQD